MELYLECTNSLRQYSTLMFHTRITSVVQSIILLGSAGLQLKNSEYFFSLGASIFSIFIGFYLYCLHKNYAIHYNGFLALSIEYEKEMGLKSCLSPWYNYKKRGMEIREKMRNKIIYHQAPFYLTVIGALIISAFSIKHLYYQSILEKINNIKTTKKSVDNQMSDHKLKALLVNNND